MTERKCAACGKIKDRNELIKITRDAHSNVFVNPDTKIFGRSAYLCYNKMCVESALKKNKLQKYLKTSIPDEVKGKLLNEF